MARARYYYRHGTWGMAYASPDSANRTGQYMEDLSKYDDELRAVDAELSRKKEADSAWKTHIKKTMNALRIYLSRDRITLRIDVYGALRFLEAQAYNCLAEGTRLSCVPERVDTAVPVYSNNGGVETLRWYSYEYLKRFDDCALYLAMVDCGLRY